MFTFFSFEEADITAIIGHAGDIVGDTMPLLIVILGIGIGLWVIRVILNLRG